MRDGRNTALIAATLFVIGCSPAATSPTPSATPAAIPTAGATPTEPPSPTPAITPTPTLAPTLSPSPMPTPGNAYHSEFGYSVSLPDTWFAGSVSSHPDEYDIFSDGGQFGATITVVPTPLEKTSTLDNFPAGTWWGAADPASITATTVSGADGVRVEFRQTVPCDEGNVEALLVDYVTLHGDFAWEIYLKPQVCGLSIEAQEAAVLEWEQTVIPSFTFDD
jgi:hypothetical protein